MLKIRGKTVATLGPEVKETFEDMISDDGLQGSAAFRASNLAAAENPVEPTRNTREIRNACQELPDFASAIQHMAIIPFTGLNIRVNPNHSEPSIQAFDELYINAISEKVPVKFLNIQVRERDGLMTKAGSHPECEACTKLVQFLKLILDAHAGQLEEISIAGSCSPLITTGTDVDSNGHRFPRLKKLALDFYDLKKPCGGEQEAYNYIRKLVSSAPNLEQLEIENCLSPFGSFCIDWDSRIENVCKFLLEGSRARLVLDHSPLDEDEQYTESVLNHLAFRHVNNRGRQVFRFLQSSRTVVESAELDLLLLLQVLRQKISLRNLRELQLNINFPYVRLKFPALMDRVLMAREGWKRCFPRLEKLKIMKSSEKLSAASLQSALSLQLPSEDNDGADFQDTVPHLEIQQLEIDSAVRLTHRYWMLICRLCPLVTTLSIPCHFIYACVRRVGNPIPQLALATNMDWIFCGLTPQELMELRGNFGTVTEYLKAVLIVPPFPPITHFSRE